MRPSWKGFMSFGLVTIPVQLYNAVEAAEEIHFSLLHKKDMGKIRNKRFCEVDGEEVEWGDIVKGYKHEDSYIEITEEDLDKADVASSSTIDILDFAKAEEIDPKYFERPCYLEPQKGGEKPYALLREALKQSHRVGIAKIVMRTREHLCCVKPDGDGIVLEIMRFADEVRSMADLKLPPASEARERELALASKLIDDMTSPFDVKKYRDEYKAKLEAIIQEKIAGREPVVQGAAPAPTKVTDLMAVLERSLAERGTAKTSGAPGAAGDGVAVQDVPKEPAADAVKEDAKPKRGRRAKA
jgi:DNA end-binding protein Ku